MGHNYNKNCNNYKNNDIFSRFICVHTAFVFFLANSAHEKEEYLALFFSSLTYQILEIILWLALFKTVNPKVTSNCEARNFEIFRK